MINDGWQEQAYAFGNDANLNARLSALLNEFCHVFRVHADGNWAAVDKPRYAAQLAAEIRARPSLIRKLISLKDPVIGNVTHAAINLNRTEAPGGQDAACDLGA